MQQLMVPKMINGAWGFLLAKSLKNLLMNMMKLWLKELVENKEEVREIFLELDTKFFK